MIQETVADYASWYHQQGFNVIPIDGKGGGATWAEWQVTQQTPQDVAALPWRRLPGIANVDGPGDVRDFDIDIATSYYPVARILEELGLPPDYLWTVISGSEEGYHITVRCAEQVRIAGVVKNIFVGLPREEQAAFRRLEYRHFRHITVLPPTPHKSGRQYRFLHGVPHEPPTYVSHETIERAFLAVATLQLSKNDQRTYASYEPHDGNTGHKGKNGSNGSNENNHQPLRLEDYISIVGGDDCGRDTPYGLTILREECTRLARQEEPGRNDLLNALAYKMGRIVMHEDTTKRVSLHTAGNELFAACNTNGLVAEGEQAVIRTLDSGLTAGMENPRGSNGDDTKGEREQTDEELKQEIRREIEEEIEQERKAEEAAALKRKEWEIRQRLLAEMGRPTAPAEESTYLTFLEFKDLRDIPRPQWLLYDVLPSKGIVFLYGPPKDGKTYVAVGMASTVATEDMAWMGRATRHGHVVYIAGEDIDDVALRFRGFADKHSLQDIPNLHIFPCPLALATDTHQLMRSLKHHYGDIDIALIIIDTLAICTLGIDESSKKDFDAVITSVEALWRTYDCCVTAIHHEGKNGEMRGTSNMEAIAMAKIRVQQVDEQVVIKSVLKRRGGKRFDDICLDWETIEFPGENDEAGQVLTTGVLIESHREGTQKPDSLSSMQEAVLTHLQSWGGVDVPRADLIKACTADKSQERSFINATSYLQRKGYIGMKKEKQRTYYSLLRMLSITIGGVTYEA
jgi:AAA domain/Bifunctional DNA primase/polymerase, N-terminal